MANTKKYVSLDKLALYDEKIKKVVSDGDAAALASAKSYADGLAANYDAAGAAKTAEANAKAYADGKDAAIQAAQKAGDDAAAAAGVADGKAVAAQNAVDTLASGAVATNTADIATLKGTGEGSVAKAIADSADTLQAGIDAVGDVADANAGDIATMKGQIAALEAGTYDDSEVRGLISANADAIGELEQTHATDKGALEAAIALKADQTALEGVSAVANAAATKTALEAEVKTRGEEITRVEGLVTAEAERAAGVESDLDERLVEVEAFFKLAEGETLDTALDTLVEIQKYITEDGTAADEMVKDIAANAKAIEDMDAAYKKADGELQGAIDLKADASALELVSGRVTTLETNSATKTELGEVSTALTEYKDAHKNDYTNAQIDAAIKVVADDVASLNDTYATDAELAQAIENEVTRANGAYAAKSLETTVSNHVADAVAHITADERTAWNGIEQKAKDYADGLNTAMDARVDVVEAKAHEHANKAELDLIATGDKAKWDEAYTKRHEHSNLSVLEGITSAKVTAWDAAEGNAKTYADGLNTAMDARVASLESWHENFVECSQEDIQGLFA